MSPSNKRGDESWAAVRNYLRRRLVALKLERYYEPHESEQRVISNQIATLKDVQDFMTQTLARRRRKKV